MLNYMCFFCCCCFYPISIIWYKCTEISTSNHNFTTIQSICSLQYLSEDEAGGGGAAVRPLEATPPGISPSVHLMEKNELLTSSYSVNSYVFLCTSIIFGSLAEMPHETNTWCKVTFGHMCFTQQLMLFPRLDKVNLTSHLTCNTS